MLTPDEDSRGQFDPDRMREIERSLNAAYRSLHRRDFIQPSREEFAEISSFLSGRVIRCPLNPDDHYRNLKQYAYILESANLQFALSMMPELVARSSRGAHLRIVIRRSSDPEHINLALEDFPCLLEDKIGQRFTAERRDGGSLYFNRLKNGESFTFRSISSL